MSAPTAAELAAVPPARSSEGKALRGRFQYGVENILAPEQREAAARREGKDFLLALFQKHRDIRATASVLTELQKETFLQAKKGTSSMSMLELINKFGP